MNPQGPISPAKAAMLGELRGHLAICEDERIRLRIEQAEIDGKEDAFRTLIARIESNLINLSTGEVRH